MNPTGTGLPVITASKSKTTPLDIPWGVIEDKWQYAAMDEDGATYLYTERPELYEDDWGLSLGDINDIGCLRIKKPDAKHWKKTLTKRP